MTSCSQYRYIYIHIYIYIYSQRIASCIHAARASTPRGDRLRRSTASWLSLSQLHLSLSPHHFHCRFTQNMFSFDGDHNEIIAQKLVSRDLGHFCRNLGHLSRKSRALFTAIQGSFPLIKSSFSLSICLSVCLSVYVSRHADHCLIVRD